MKTRNVFVTVALIIGTGAGAVLLMPHEAPKVGLPFMTVLIPNDPLTVYLPISNKGYGTLQVNIGIWGSPLDISHGTVNNLEKHNADQDSRGCGPIIVSSNTTFFVPSYQDYDDHYLLGEIAHKRKYPVHLAYAWRRGGSEGSNTFTIPPDKDIVLAVSKPDAH